MWIHNNGCPHKQYIQNPVPSTTHAFIHRNNHWIENLPLLLFTVKAWGIAFWIPTWKTKSSHHLNHTLFTSETQVDPDFLDHTCSSVLDNSPLGVASRVGIFSLPYVNASPNHKIRDGKEIRDDGTKGLATHMGTRLGSSWTPEAPVVDDSLLNGKLGCVASPEEWILTTCTVDSVKFDEQ